MDRLYYTYLIIKESLDYIPAIEIKKQLEENYQIKVDIKTVYQAIRNINELSNIFIKKRLLKPNIEKGIVLMKNSLMMDNFNIYGIVCFSITI